MIDLVLVRMRGGAAMETWEAKAKVGEGSSLILSVTVADASFTLSFRGTRSLS